MKNVMMTSSGDPQLNKYGPGLPHIHFVRVYEKGRHVEKLSLDLAILRLTTFFTDVLKTISQLLDTRSRY
jgi:hypothetical protein